jgi:hypothetical protein
MPEPKQPQDHKPKASEPFVWTAPDGRTVKFKPYNRLPFDLFRQARNMSELESIFLFVEYAVSKKDQEVLYDASVVTIEDVNQAIADWQAAAGVTPGE